jgi:3-oxoacyl-[acyl-carrier-protein] synthase I
VAGLMQRISAALAPSNATSPRAVPLLVRSAGLCCAVGYQLPAASTAIRAGLDHFQQGQFKTQRGDKLVIARLPENKLWGGPRMARWLQGVVRDCLRGQSDLQTNRVAVLWLAPASTRTGLDEAAYDEIYANAIRALGHTFHASSGVMPLGRAGLAAALQHTVYLLRNDKLQAVLLAGVDSLLDPATLNDLLHQERLIVPGNSDGFIPGEAAAAVLLQLAAPTDNGLQLIGYAHAQEAGRVDGSVPSRAQGLTTAMRQALTGAECDYTDLQFRCSDQNGESFYSREATHAITRVAPVGGDQLHLLTVADCIGEVGAAMGPAMLAHLNYQMPHTLGPGRCGLLHLAGDDGARCAVVVRHTAH